MARRRRARGKLLFGGVAVVALWAWPGGPGRVTPAETGGMLSAAAEGAPGGSSEARAAAA